MMIEDPGFSLHTGKTNATLAWISQTPGIKSPVVYAADRKEVEKLDLTRFAETFGPDQSRASLRRLYGKTFHTIDGYDDCPQPLFEIPAVRRYYSYLAKRWPCWLFTASLAGPCFRVLAFSVIKDITVMRTDIACGIAVTQGDLWDFVEAGIPPAAILQKFAGIGEKAAAQRIKDVCAYLGIQAA